MWRPREGRVTIPGYDPELRLSFMFNQFIAAWNFLTAFPFPFSGKESYSSGRLAGSLIAFPWVGLVLGLILEGAYLGLGRILPPAIVSLAVVLLLVIMTRGLHLDGLADTVDGLQGKTPEASLRIMKDSAIGAFGALGLIFVIGFKVTALYDLPPEEAIKALWLTPILGRSVFVTLLVYFPYARPEGGIATPFMKDSKPWHWVLATLFTLAAGHFIASWRGELLALIILSLAFLSGMYFKRRLGGITGDVVGGAGEAAEALSLILWDIYAHSKWG